MVSPYGLHILVDAKDSNQLESTLTDYIIPARPKWVNVTGGAKFTQAKAYVEQILTRALGTNVILRCSGFSSGSTAFSDNGVWKTMTPQNWVDLWVKPNLTWLQLWKPIFMVDNESIESGSQLEAYANWMAEVIRLCSILGVKLAVGRFPAGTPQHGEYIHLLPMFKALAQFGGIWSPNEYFGQTDELSNDLVGRFQEGLKVCDDNNISRPEVVIGEYSVAYATKAVVNGQTQIHLDPDKGFSHPFVGWSEEQLFNKVQFNYVNWIGPHGATVCVFCDGRQPPYETFSVGPAFYKIALLHAGDIGNLPGNPPADAPPPPQESNVVGGIAFTDPRWFSAMLRPVAGVGSVNIRLRPSTAGNLPVGFLKVQTQGFIAQDPAWGSWSLIRFNDVYGWISTQYLSWDPLEEIVTVTVPRALYLKLIDTLKTASAQSLALAAILEQIHTD